MTPLQVGDKAPNISGTDHDGNSVAISDFLGKKLVIFFYPKANTPGCTAEACDFRDQFEAFRELDIQVVGISRDNIATHHKFKKEHRLPFELLSDASGKVCKSYDALIPLVNMPKRVTYLLDSEHKIAGIYEGLFENKSHVDAMLRKLKK